MAFIRSYSSAVGDPGRKRGFFKRLKKLKIGKALGRVARATLPVASFIPGVGGLAGGLARRLMPKKLHSVFGRALSIARETPGLQEQLLGLAQQQGYDVSAFTGGPEVEELEAVEDYSGGPMVDIMGDPGPPRPAKRRKQAGAGPKAKASRKRVKRQERRARGKGGPGVGEILSANLGKAAGGVGQLGQAFAARDLGSALGLITGKKGTLGAGLGGRRRRSMNVTNVKALRRSLRRIEGFEKMARRVMPRLMKRYGRSSSARTGSRGHKPGCRCVACKAA